MRISGFRLMWLLVVFDLPVTTRTHRRNYKRFVDELLGQGFFRMQFSVYARPCATEENAATEFQRVTSALPPAGEVRILRFTDKQWARMVCYRARKRQAIEEAPEQFTFFDGDSDDEVWDGPDPEFLKTTQGEGPPPPRPPSEPKPPKPPDSDAKRRPQQDQAGFDFFD